MFKKTIIVGAVLAVSAACAASKPSSGSADVANPTRGLARNRDIITQEELNANPTVRAQSVYEVIRSLRPQYLVNRGNNTMKDSTVIANTDVDAGKVHASVDGGRVVDATDLTMSGNEILEIRYLNVAQANLRFGTGARQGPIILVMLKKQ